MKVLSNHVSKILEGGMDTFIMAPLTTHVKSEHTFPAQTNKTTPADIPAAESINQRRWRNVFRKIQKKERKTTLFGKPLSQVFVDKNTPPKPITEILRLLCRNGPSTVGVFRRAGNARITKETKELLNAGVEVDFSDKPVVLLAALLKDFIREIPGGLLLEKLHQSWVTTMATSSITETCSAVKKVIEQLPEENSLLLRHVSFMLYTISRNAEENKMNPRNLAVCIAPNLLQPGSTIFNTDQVEAVERVTDLTEFLIGNYSEVFGERIQHLLDDSDEEEMNDSQDSLSPLQHDSAYETDADGEKGSCVQLASASGEMEERLISGSSTPAKEACNTFRRPFIRRVSEPVITLPGTVREQPPLTRSHTSSLLRAHQSCCCCQNMLLRKQISDECIVQRSCRSVDMSVADGHCSSSCSLESVLSSASESSVFANSPSASPSCQRRSLQCEAAVALSFHRQSQERQPTLQRRSQSLRSAATHSRASLRRAGSSLMQREKRLSLKSCALPEDLEVQRKPLAHSSAEVFQQVDSRMPGLPPSYEQATQSTPASRSPPASQPMTVQEARRLSALKDPSLNKHPEHQPHSPLKDPSIDKHPAHQPHSPLKDPSIDKHPAHQPHSLLKDPSINTHPAHQTHSLLKDPSIDKHPAHQPHSLLNAAVTSTLTNGQHRAQPAVSAMVCRSRSISETDSRAPSKDLLRRCSQPLFEELMHARESYV